MGGNLLQLGHRKVGLAVEPAVNLHAAPAELAGELRLVDTPLVEKILKNLDGWMRAGFVHTVSVARSSCRLQASRTGKFGIIRTVDVQAPSQG